MMDLFRKLKEMKILLMDDDELIRDSLSLFFENEGCCLLALETGEEGIKALKKKDYDIIIADYRLPGMDGLEFFKQIKSSHPDAIKVLITAYGTDEIAFDAMAIGINRVVGKPITSDILEEVLSSLIKSRSKGNNSLTGNFINKSIKKGEPQ